MTQESGLSAPGISYNGIDSVDLSGQQAILREVRRVLRPGGYFVFSSLNRTAAKQAGHWPDWSVFRGVGSDPLRLLRGMARLTVGGINRLRLGAMHCDDGEAAIGALSACNFALVTVFVTLEGQVRRLRAAGFTVEAILAPDGRAVAEGADDPAPWHHFVARKAP